MPTQRPVIAFAHRGGAYHPEIEGLENTVAAFTHAVALGYTHLETDVHLTRDGVLLAFHDAVLDRVTDWVGAVRDLTRAETREARIGGREEVPSLVALLDAFPEAQFNIDLKASGTPAALAALVEERGLHDRLVVGSFSRRRIREFRRLTAGRVATSADPFEIAAWRLAPTTRLARLGGDAFAALQVPHRRAGVPVVTRRLIERAHAAGKQVHVWTIDDAEEMRELIALGVDGIFTDRTDVLKDVLQELGRW